MTLIRQINLYLTEYNVFIAICSAAFLHFFSLLMFTPFPVEMYIFTFCSTLSTYNLFRAYPTFKDFLTGFRKGRFYVIILGFTGCTICFLLLPVEIQLFYTVVGFMTMLYKFNLFGIKNLRSIPFLKLPVITMVWLLSGSIFLLINIDADSDVSRIAGLMVMQFCFIIAITIPFDVFGLIEDDMTTIPSKIGIGKALSISKVLLVVYLAAGFLIHQKIEFLYASLIVATLTFIAIHFSPYFRQKWAQYYLLDGTIILQTLTFYLFLY